MSENKKSLESALKEKIGPLLEEAMEKQLGITIPKMEADITDKLKQPLNIYVPFNLPFSESKQLFKKEFFKRELQKHRGNISHLAQILGVDRRSIHRIVKDLRINLRDVRMKPLTFGQYREEFIGQAIRSALDNYKEILQPGKMEKMYQQVGFLSRHLARLLPEEELTWKETEKEFEKQFLEQILKKNEWNISQTAEEIRIRPETLSRKIRKLGLK